MKILAIGDFHGRFPKKFESLISKEKIDLVVSNGDYFPFHYRKLWFKHCYESNLELWEVIGKKRYKELIRKDLEMGENALKKLNKLKIPVYTITGNIDYTRQEHEANMNRRTKKYGPIKKWEWDDQDFFSPIIKKYKNIKRFDHSFRRFNEYIFIGTFGSTNPGSVQSKTYKKRRKKLDKLFKKFSKENKQKKVIFVSHNVPYKTKLDKIGMKAHKLVRGKHYGSKLVRRIINRHQPVLHIGGHIHEGRGKQKLGRTLAINPGAAHDGQAAIITLPKNKKQKLKVRFIR